MFEGLQIELSKFDWSGVSGLSDVVMVVLTVLLLIGLKQGSQSIKESSLSRDADILRWAMFEMDKLKPQIKIITNAHKGNVFCDCTNTHEKDFKTTWEKEELEAAQIVGVNLQRIGYMALHNLISRNHFMNIWGPMYLSTWYALEAWVKHKRIELGEPLEISDGAYSRMYLEQYAKYCENNLPHALVKNERMRFNLPSLAEEKKTNIFERIKIKFSSSEVLDLQRDKF